MGTPPLPIQGDLFLSSTCLVGTEKYQSLSHLARGTRVPAESVCVCVVGECETRDQEWELGFGGSYL